MSSLGLYAGRRRKKPAQRSMKLEASQNAKSNPSKRHRDRLNTEMERLATLLPFPQDVISKLDKLSILRLSVSYLRAKNYFHAVVQKPSGSPGAKSAGNRIISPGPLKESELLLQALNGFVLVVTSDGLVFYVSHTIQDYLGFHQCDVIQQSIYELVHKDDREELRRNLHWAMNPQSTSCPSGEAEAGLPVTTYVPQQLPLENSSFLERQFVCRFRCLLDNSSGFLLLQIQGRLKFLRGQSRHTEDKGQASLQFALFALATPLQPPSILEIRTRNMIFRTKHKLDFTPLGCDAKATIILGYDEVELTMRGTGYQFIHAADMLHCAENHIRMMKTGETGLTFFRLLTKKNCWAWVQANARLVYKNGQPDYIIATQRPLSNEEGDEQLRKRIRQFPFALTSSEALLYDGSEMQIDLESCNHNPKNQTIDPSSLLGAMMQQDHSIYVRPAAVEAKLSISHEMLGFSSSSVSSCVSPQGWQSPRSMEKSLLIKQESSVNENLDSGAVIPDKLCEVLEILGLKSEDVENLHDNQFMQVSDFSDELLSNDDILSYIQDSLMTSDGLFLPGTNLPDVSMQELEASLGQSKLAEGHTQVEVLHESKSLAGPTTSSAQIPQDERFVEENTFWSDARFETKQCNPANVNPSIPTNTTAFNGNQQCVKGRSGNIPQVIGMQGPFLPPDYASCQINNPAEHSKAMYFAQNESLQGKPFQRANKCGTNLQMALPTQIPGKVAMKFVNPINNQTTTQRHCAHNTNPRSFPVPPVHPDMDQTSLFAAQCTPVHALSQRLTLGAYQGPSQWAEQMQWQNTVGPSPLAPLYLSNEQPMQNQIWSRVANIIPSPVEASTVFPSMLCHQTPTNTPAYNWTNIPAPGGQNMQMAEMDSHPSCQFVGQEPGKINNYMSCPQAFPQQMLEPIEANSILGFPDNVHQNLEKRAVVSYSFTSNQCG